MSASEFSSKANPNQNYPYKHLNQRSTVAIQCTSWPFTSSYTEEKLKVHMLSLIWQLGLYLSLNINYVQQANEHAKQVMM